MTESELLTTESMTEIFIFESLQLIEQLEEILLASEKRKALSAEEINEIFRIMHTIKGSSAMMRLDGLSALSHSLEDLFCHFRENGAGAIDFTEVCDLVLSAADRIKSDIALVEGGELSDAGGHPDLEAKIRDYLGTLNNAEFKKYTARIFFEEGGCMENIRAFGIVHKLRDRCGEIFHRPRDIENDPASAEHILTNGFTMYFSSCSERENIEGAIRDTLYIRDFELAEVDSYHNEIADLLDDAEGEAAQAEQAEQGEDTGSGAAPVQGMNTRQNIISVNVSKLDKLMDIVGEIVITEAMVTKNPDLQDLQLDNFNKAARQLRKLTDELQDIVMSVRMLPVAATFNKMHRIVRDMCRKLDKEAELILSGEETEVDKNIIDNLSDPLMHLIRNALDHGLESREERLAAGKPGRGSIYLDAKNSGGDVWITIRDDGKGLDKARILEKARDAGLLERPAADYSDKEIYSFIMLPGFSTKENVSEFSGRGVGMDVVRESIEKLGGSVQIQSEPGHGTAISVRIPLTLAIIEGMMIAVGGSRYIIPTNTIRESFRPDGGQILTDNEGNELIMLRGQCCRIIRLHDKFGVTARALDIRDGIIVVTESDSSTVCLFADQIIGEQQVVVKPLPAYIRKTKGIAGCTILGDGSISLILDVSGILVHQ